TMNRLPCYPRCDVQLGSIRAQASTAISVPCVGQLNPSPIELIISTRIHGARQRSAYKLQQDPEFESHWIGIDSYLANLEVKFYEISPDDFNVNACITPQDGHRKCFMDQIISKKDAYEASCGNVREPGGISLLFMSALLVFICLMIGMALTVFVYRMFRRFRDSRRPAREFQPIICDPHKLSSCSPPRPFHAQLTVVMEEEEDKCSPSTPIKDFFWRSSSPTPNNTPRGTISTQRSSPIISSLLPGKKTTPKPTNV
ncbi:hypothetical protein PMAYCL1PPCAC_21204, partial [Pristionchus mayeri]